MWSRMCYNCTREPIGARCGGPSRGSRGFDSWRSHFALAQSNAGLLGLDARRRRHTCWPCCGTGKAQTWFRWCRYGFSISHKLTMFVVHHQNHVWRAFLTFLTCFKNIYIIEVINILFYFIKFINYIRELKFLKYFIFIT